MACIAFVGSLFAHLIKFCPLPLFLSWALALTILLRSSALLHKSAAVNFDDFFFCLRSLIQNHNIQIINPTGLFPGCIKSIFNSPFYQSKTMNNCIFQHGTILISDAVCYEISRPVIYIYPSQNKLKLLGLVQGQLGLVQGQLGLVQGQCRVSQGQFRVSQGQFRVSQGQFRVSLGSVSWLVQGQFRVRAEPNGPEVVCAQIYRVTYFVTHCSNSTVIKMASCGKIH